MILNPGCDMNGLSADYIVRCKYCGSTSISKCGSYKGMARYLCRKCRRKFKPDDTAFHMTVQGWYVGEVLKRFYAGASVQEIAKSMYDDFGRLPSREVIYQWIIKYSLTATSLFQYYPPHPGDTWVLMEVASNLGRRNLYSYDMFDSSSSLLFVSEVYFARPRNIVGILVEKAYRMMGRKPGLVLIYVPHPHYLLLEKDYDFTVEHVQREDFTDYRNGITQQMHRARMNIFRRARKMDTAAIFLAASAINYNYFEVKEQLQCQTPAENAGIEYPCHTWTDVVKMTQEEILD